MHITLPVLLSCRERLILACGQKSFYYWPSLCSKQIGSNNSIRVPLKLSPANQDSLGLPLLAGRLSTFSLSLIESCEAMMHLRFAHARCNS